MGTGNYRATSNNMKLVHCPLMGGLLHLVQRGGDWAVPSPPGPLLAVPNVTAHSSSAAGIPITVLLYNNPLLCGFNVPTCFGYNGALAVDTILCRFEPGVKE